MPPRSIEKGGSESARNLTSAWGTDNVAKLVFHQTSGTHGDHRLFINGVDQNAVTNVVSDNVGSAVLSDEFNIGARNESSSYITGDIAEIIVYDRLLSANERFEVEKYLAKKYDLYTAESSPVEISPAGGTFTASQSVTLTTAGGGDIYYTTDGSEPTDTGGTLYTGTPVSVTATTTLKARAYETGAPASAVAEEVFTIEPGLTVPADGP